MDTYKIEIVIGNIKGWTDIRANFLPEMFCRIYPKCEWEYVGQDYYLGDLKL